MIFLRKKNILGVIGKIILAFSKISPPFCKIIKGFDFSKLQQKIEESGKIPAEEIFPGFIHFLIISKLFDF